jgi:adenine phosphoribosyltransferase
VKALTAGQKTAIRDSIRSIPDFPKKGILFRDITPLLAHKGHFRDCVRHFVGITKGKVDAVVSIESRGFIFGSALAYALGTGFIPVRKEGKLPHKKTTVSYDLEYGKATVEMHEDALAPGSNVLLIDDVLATGGTVLAATHLVERLGARIQGLYFLIELKGLKGRAKLGGRKVHSLVQF